MEYFSDEKDSAAQGDGSQNTYLNENDPVTDSFYKSSSMQLDSDDEVSIVIPNEIAAQIKTGGYKIILEPITGRSDNDTVSYTIRSIPSNETPPTKLPETDSKQSDHSEQCDSEEAGGGDY